MQNWLGTGVPPRATRRNIETTSTVYVLKTSRSQLPAKDQMNLQDRCTKGLTTKFSLLEPISETSSMDSLEKVYSVTTRLSEFKRRLEMLDMLDVFTIPDTYVMNNENEPEPAPTATGIDLFSAIDQASIEQICKAIRYYKLYGQIYHLENCNWSGESLLNSCDKALKDKIIETTESIPSIEKGGPLYLKVMMTLIIATSSKSLRAMSARIEKLTLRDFDGENVSKASSYLRACMTILSNNNGLPSDMINVIFRVFENSSTADFNSYAAFLMNTIEEQGTTTTATHDSVLTKLEKKYIDLLQQSMWVAKSTTKDQNSGFIAKNNGGVNSVMCFNCGSLSHILTKCPHPRNDADIEARKQLMNYKSPSDKSPHDGKVSNANRRDKGPRKTNNKKSDPSKIPPKKDESHTRKVNGRTLYWCGKPQCCKWNPHHLTENHPSSNAPPAANVTDGGADTGGDETSTVTGSQNDDESSHYAGATAASLASGF